ncbi:MAG: protein kinase [Methanoregula sp.]
MEKNTVDVGGQPVNYEINNGQLKLNGNDVLIDSRYQVEFYIASGANGIVFKGKDTFLSRPVAIKIWIMRSGDSRPINEKFLSEIRKISQLNRPRIAQIYYGQIIENIYYYAIYELIEGIPLKKWLETERSIEERQEISDKIFLEILRCHEKGIYHGDLHSKNVLITEDIEIKIIDFGTSIFCKDIYPQNRERQLLLQTGYEIFPEVKKMKLLDEKSLLQAPAPCIPLTFIQIPKLLLVLNNHPKEDCFPDDGFSNPKVRDGYFTMFNDPFVETPFFDFKRLITCLTRNYSPDLVTHYLDCLAGMMVEKDLSDKLGYLDFKSHYEISEKNLHFFNSIYTKIRVDFIQRINEEYKL